MDQITKLYMNRAKILQEEVNRLEKLLNEAKAPPTDDEIEQLRIRAYREKDSDAEQELNNLRAQYPDQVEKVINKGLGKPTRSDQTNSSTATTTAATNQGSSNLGGSNTNSDEQSIQGILAQTAKNALLSAGSDLIKNYGPLAAGLYGAYNLATARYGLSPKSSILKPGTRWSAFEFSDPSLAKQVVTSKGIETVPTAEGGSIRIRPRRSVLTHPTDLLTQPTAEWLARRQQVQSMAEQERLAREAELKSTAETLKAKKAADPINQELNKAVDDLAAKFEARTAAGRPVLPKDKLEQTQALVDLHKQSVDPKVAEHVRVSQPQAERMRRAFTLTPEEIASRAGKQLSAAEGAAEAGLGRVLGKGAGAKAGAAIVGDIAGRLGAEGIKQTQTYQDWLSGQEERTQKAMKDMTPEEQDRYIQFLDAAHKAGELYMDPVEAITSTSGYQKGVEGVGKGTEALMGVLPPSLQTGVMKGLDVATKVAEIGADPIGSVSKAMTTGQDVQSKHAQTLRDRGFSEREISQMVYNRGPKF